MDTLEFCQSILIELIKGIITFILGFISFKAFENYRNRKDNNKLYIQIKKLKRELEENESKIESTLNEHIEIEVLERNFYINEKYSDELYRFYNRVAELSYNYIKTGYYYRNNEPTFYEDYLDTPYTLIEDTKLEIMYMENSDIKDLHRIRCLRELLDIYKNQNIYDEFQVIQKEAMVLLDKELDFQEPIMFIHAKLSEFNSLIQNEKQNKLQSFCTMLFDEENHFTDYLNAFRRLKYLKIKYNPNNTQLKLSFNLLESSDMDVLAYYNADIYLELEQLYSRLNSLELQFGHVDKLIDAKEILDKELNSIIGELENKSEKMIKKINK